MNRTVLIALYAAFAAIATAANLLVQRLVLGLSALDAQIGYAAALCAGTLVGLVVKYMLDKRWIFRDFSEGIGAQSKRFTLYSATGIATTAIFWGTETLFWSICQTEAARETGAVLGLAVGYVVKWRLDHRFVFSPGQDARA